MGKRWEPINRLIKSSTLESDTFKSTRTQSLAKFDMESNKISESSSF